MNTFTQFFVVSLLFYSAGISGTFKPRTTFKRHYVSPEDQASLHEAEQKRAELQFLKTVKESVYDAVSDFLAKANEENATTIQSALKQAQKKALKAFEKQQDAMLAALKIEQEKRLVVLDQWYSATIKSQQNSMEALLAFAKPIGMGPQNTPKKLAAHNKMQKDKDATAVMMPVVAVSENVPEKSVDVSIPQATVMGREQKKGNTEIAAVVPITEICK